MFFFFFNFVGIADFDVLSLDCAYRVLGWGLYVVHEILLDWSGGILFTKNGFQKKKTQKIPDDKEERSRRSHWADAYIPKTECCGEYTKGKARTYSDYLKILIFREEEILFSETLVEKCCQFYEHIFKRPLSKEQQRLGWFGSK